MAASADLDCILLSPLAHRCRSPSKSSQRKFMPRDNFNLRVFVLRKSFLCPENQELRYKSSPVETSTKSVQMHSPEPRRAIQNSESINLGDLPRPKSRHVRCITLICPEEYTNIDSATNDDDDSQVDGPINFAGGCWQDCLERLEHLSTEELLTGMKVF